jgi:hypothetical protein
VKGRIGTENLDSLRVSLSLQAPPEFGIKASAHPLNSSHEKISSILAGSTEKAQQLKRIRFTGGSSPGEQSC